MAITFDTKYPTALKNATWQSKKSFKDKTKSKTKTGLGEALTLAEKDWGKIDFNKLIAAKQNLTGKNATQYTAAYNTAKAYLDGPVVTKAINSLNAAANKARTTAKNTALSAKAITAAGALSGPLLAQVKLLHDIKLNDFAAPVSVGNDIRRWEPQHTEALRSMDSIRDDLKDAKDKKDAWDSAHADRVIESGVKVSGDLAKATGEKAWQDNHDHWRKLQVAYFNANRVVQMQQGAHVSEEIEKFADLIQTELGHIFS